MVFSCTDDVATGLKDALTHCYECKGRKVSLSDHEDNDEKLIRDFNYDHEIVVFQIRSQAMEKLRQKPRICMERLTYHSKEEPNIEKEEGIEFCSVGSSFSECCTSDLSVEAYMTAKIEFSRCSSLKGEELENQWKMYYLNGIRKGSVIQELCHCQGWPFGLGRKASLLPPLPKSPAESWSWRKPNRVAPIPFI
ncbi:hypothetical protein HID58_069466 [Brassica napus]|uniref:BnaC06g00080D protein n=2 Tax=Brassica napus TaxID=3708 RepID=A0A078FRI1_BRANA|nr:uncharacterized protein BNAC06G00080D [Brassica napus]XP_013701705.1 uncharacterized protein BNAC06G00080D [Brassica napus]KAH0872104.1 hypothetical protein HID58_069466 [Brassica napus]CAF2054024.1 unnamed protein product [Brassica napus]CDY17075.1 BnaC06g00080D [Brassica napus]